MAFSILILTDINYYQIIIKGLIIIIMIIIIIIKGFGGMNIIIIKGFGGVITLIKTLLKPHHNNNSQLSVTERRPVQ